MNIDKLKIMIQFYMLFRSFSKDEFEILDIYYIKEKVISAFGKDAYQELVNNKDIDTSSMTVSLGVEKYNKLWKTKKGYIWGHLYSIIRGCAEDINNIDNVYKIFVSHMPSIENSKVRGYVSLHSNIISEWYKPYLEKHKRTLKIGKMLEEE